jgi:3-hydroxyacyl-[acyl-carrier-protein] dehydratase
MPPQPFADLDSLDFDNPLATIEEVRKINPHRHEFEQLSAILFRNDEDKTFGAHRDIRDDEFWVRGHIPGRPLFPGVLMIEAAAQVCSYFIVQILQTSNFVGFGGVNNVKFRGQVTPPARLIILGKMVDIRPRRAICDTQGFVDGQMVYEGQIIGMPL